MKRAISIILCLALAMCFYSCAGPTHQQRGAKTGVLIGAAGGAILGQVIGRNTEATLLGAGIGAAVGGLSGGEMLTDNKTGVGSAFKWESSLGPLKMSSEEKVVEWVEGERVAYEGQHSGVQFHSEMQVRPVGKGTEMTVYVSYDTPMGVVGQLAEKAFLQRMIEDHVGTSLENLRGIFECGSLEEEKGSSFGSGAVRSMARRVPARSPEMSVTSGVVGGPPSSEGSIASIPSASDWRRISGRASARVTRVAPSACAISAVYWGTLAVKCERLETAPKTSTSASRPSAMIPGR